MTSTIRSISSICFSGTRPPISGRSTFSVNTAVGASSAPLAVERIAESSAPKNITCANSGVFARMSCGRISWKSSPSSPSTVRTFSGSISSADTAMNIGTNAKTR